MTSKQFLSTFFAAFLGIGALVAATNWYADFYGLFRPATRRSLSVYGEERAAKFLYSMRYIPEAFDGVLLGSSTSDNLNTNDLHGYRIYNASINGGNVSDMKPLAENIFRARRMRVTILCAHRYLTNDHVLKTDLMTPRQYWSALGSPQLFAAYLSRAADRAGLTTNPHDDFGVLHYTSSVNSANASATIDKALVDIRRGTAAVGNYSIDPVALADLDSVLRLVRGNSERLVVYYPPTPARVLALRSAEVARYRSTIGALLAPRDEVIDFNADAYAEWRADEKNFVDAVHLSQGGSRLVLREIQHVLAKDSRRGANKKESGT